MHFDRYATYMDTEMERKIARPPGAGGDPA
jgi:hypothetical protein